MTDAEWSALSARFRGSSDLVLGGLGESHETRLKFLYLLRGGIGCCDARGASNHGTLRGLGFEGLWTVLVDLFPFRVRDGRAYAWLGTEGLGLLM